MLYTCMYKDGGGGGYENLSIALKKSINKYMVYPIWLIYSFLISYKYFFQESKDPKRKEIKHFHKQAFRLFQFKLILERQYNRY